MTLASRATGVLGLSLALVLGTGIAASAAFSDVTSVDTSVSTLTVAPPTGLVLDDSCITTTTTVKETVHKNPGARATSTTYYDSTTTTAPSASNVQGTTTTTVAGPKPHETTTTTVTTNTDLHVTLSWTGSTARGANGYRISARLGDGTATPLMTTALSTTTATSAADADALAHQPTLFVSTLTSYGWTADSTRTQVLAC